MGPRYCVAGPPLSLSEVMLHLISMPPYILGAGFWTQDIYSAIVIVILPNANKVHPCSVYPRGNKRSSSRAGRHLWKYRGGCGLARLMCSCVFVIDFHCFFFPFQVVRKMMWLMDHVFKYTNFGLVSLIHGDFFIRQVRNTAGSGIISDFSLSSPPFLRKGS